MKHLKSSLKDLRYFFDQTITVREITEPLVSFDADHEARNVRDFMAEHSFDVVGVRERGSVVGYVRREELDGGTIRDDLIAFSENDAIPGSSPLLEAVQRLKNRNEVFVTLLGQVGGILTCGDLQKTPVRMWLFGLISMIEMQMLRLIREAFPDSGWKVLMTQNRLNLAKEIFKDRKKRNFDTDLSDCLQWCDKVKIVLNHDELTALFGLPDKASGKKTLKDLEKLRNDLAHAQDIITGRWPELADLTHKAEVLLENLEKASIRHL